MWTFPRDWPDTVFDWTGRMLDIAYPLQHHSTSLAGERVVLIAAPGFDKEEVSVQQAEGGLEVSGKKPKEEENTYCRTFRLRVYIPSEFDVSRAVAKMDCGLLKIVVPPKKDTKKVIPIG